MPQQELVVNMLRYVVDRCAAICSNLNSETHGHERGSDCARRIKQEADALIEQTLLVHSATNSTTISTVPPITAEAIAWLGTEEGRRSLADAMAKASASIETLNKERQVDTALLHQPFGMEHKPTK